MHRKLVFILTMLAMVIGSLSQAPAASAGGAAKARTPAFIVADRATAAKRVAAARRQPAHSSRLRTQGKQQSQSDLPAPGAPPGTAIHASYHLGTRLTRPIPAQHLSSRPRATDAVPFQGSPATPGPSPAAPANLSGTISGSPLQVTLNWTNNASPPAAQLTIERSTDSGFATNLAFFAVAGDVATYTDSTVVTGATYYYQVRAETSFGVSSTWSSAWSTATAAPSGFSGTISVTPSVILTWTNANQASPPMTPSATQLVIQRAVDAGFTQDVVDVTVAGTATSYIDSTVVKGVTYYYQVQAENPLSSSAWVGPFSTAPQAPTGLSGTISSGVGVTVMLPPGRPPGSLWRPSLGPPPGSLGPPPGAGPSVTPGTPQGPSVTLTWTNNDTIPPATQVEIQRATRSDFSDEITLATTGPAPASYTDSTVARGTTYYYRVRAEDPVSHSGWSNTFETDPAAPTGLTGTIAASPPLSVTLTWTSPQPATPSATPPPTLVLIERATNASFTRHVKDFTPTAPTDTSYTDPSVLKGRSYYYRVQTQDLVSDSPWSNAVHVQTASSAHRRTSSHRRTRRSRHQRG